MADTGALELDAATDHRVRVARERRDRMRKRLLTALMVTYERRLQSGPPSVDDVIQEADVSRASFYKYFDSVEEAVNLLGAELGDEMVHTLKALHTYRTRPFFIMAVGIQVFLLRSVADPLWGAFVSRTGRFAGDTDFVRGLTLHLTEARDQGDLRFKELEAAISLLVGTLMEAIAYIVRNPQVERSFVEDASALILRGLGVEASAAEFVVQDCAHFIRELAPERLPWWRDPWT